LAGFFRQWRLIGAGIGSGCVYWFLPINLAMHARDDMGFVVFRTSNPVAISKESGYRCVCSLCQEDHAPQPGVLAWGADDTKFIEVIAKSGCAPVDRAVG